MEVGCITNHTSARKRFLREMHGFDRFVRWWTVSDLVAARKPDAAIFEAFLATAGLRADGCFVDDLPQNLEGARRLGFATVAFAPTGDPGPGHVVVDGFAGLASLVLEADSPLTGAASTGPVCTRGANAGATPSPLRSNR
ncbi:MAG: HAD family hydrolase [Actinomycetota bacterium]